MALKAIFLLGIFLASAASARTAVSKRELRAGKWYGLVSVQSWQDTMTLTSSSGKSQELYTSAFGFGAGGGILVYLGDLFVLDLGAGVFTAQSDAGLPGTLPTQLLYSARNQRTFGGNANLGVLWATQDRDVYLGPSLVIVAKDTAWPEPGSGYQLTRDRSVAVGGVIDCRVEKGAWVVNPRAGFLSSLKSVYWSLSVGLSN